MTARITLAKAGTAHVATGLPVLDHLLTTLARSGSFDLSLEVAPADAEPVTDLRVMQLEHGATDARHAGSLRL